MNTSLRSVFHGAQPTHLPHCHNPRRNGKFHIISFRSTTNSNRGRETNFYQVLSLRSEHASVDEIRKAYRSMALVYHPDVCHPSKKEEFTQMFIQLHKAYQTLTDPSLRKKHDRELGLKRVESGRRERGEFERERWEEQLFGLKIRSDSRMMRKECLTCIKARGIDQDLELPSNLYVLY